MQTISLIINQKWNNKRERNHFWEAFRKTIVSQPDPWYDSGGEYNIG